jgi:hypothetical protein
MALNSNADPISEKREAYNAAIDLLAKGDETSLRYAALEFRRSIEAIVYAKLRVYDVLLPEDSVRKWQPPQALDALIVLEPNAEETFVISVALETEPGKLAPGPYQQIGIDERPKAKWIKKTWHKLGYYLHAEWPFGSLKPRTSLRQFLEKTRDDLLPFINNSFTAVTSMSIEFTCANCGAKVKIFEKAIDDSNYKPTCLSCGVRYRTEKEAGGRIVFYPDEQPLTCECGRQNFVPSHYVKLGYRLPCRACHRTFEVVDIEWKYVVLENQPDDTDPND